MTTDAVRSDPGRRSRFVDRVRGRFTITPEQRAQRVGIMNSLAGRILLLVAVGMIVAGAWHSHG